MNVLVTGGAGFIGSHVVDAFVETGHRVSVVDDPSAGRCANVNPAADFYETDFCAAELDQVFAHVQPDVVSHHAARMAGRRSVAVLAYHARVNVLGSVDVLKRCRRRRRLRRMSIIRMDS